MLVKYKYSIKKYVFLFSITAVLTSCVNKDEFFQLPDRNGIDAGAIFNTEGAVQLHLNRAYDVIVPQFPFHIIPDRHGVHLASDENYLPNTDQWARAALGMQTPLGNHDVRYTGNIYGFNAGNNRYFDISRCNEAIVAIPESTLPENTKKAFLGQYHALRAIVYFEMVKVYGGVPLILEPLNPENVTTAVNGRASAAACFEQIIKDLDTSIEMLQGISWADSDGRGKINTLIATCLKAKVLFYWASPQFNPLNDPKHPYDANRWQTAFDANKIAYEMCLAAGRSLVPNYADIFRLEGTNNTEAIFVRTYSSSIERRGHNTEARSRPTSQGGSPYSGFRPTLKMLNAYPMKDGNPIGTGAYTYDALMFWKDRDPRFEATIAYNGGVWALSGNNTRKQWTYNSAAGESNIQALYVKRFTIPSLATGAVPYTNNIGGNGMDWIEIRLAEVMMDYADCANEMTARDLTLAKNMIRDIRKRAKIEEGAGGNDYGLGSINSKEQMRDLILRERMVEFAFENKRNSDLRRSRTMHLLSENMSTIEITATDSVIHPITGRKDATLAVLHSQATPGVLVRETINVGNRTEYAKYFKQHTVITPNFPAYNIPEFHYFYTFHNDFVNTGVNIQPTIGWAGGTFDPLDN